MAENKDHLREWSKQLEAGEREGERLAVAARLERAAQDEPAAPSVEFRRQLRRDLLNQHAAITHKPAGRLWRWAGSVAAISLLAVIIATTWLSMSSAGRATSGGAPAIEVAATATANTATPAAAVVPMMTPTATPFPSGYVLLDYSVSGGLVIETTEPGNAQKTTMRLVPGHAAEIVTRWSIPAGAGQTPLFSLHLLDSEGRLISQADAQLQPTAGSAGQTAEAILMLDIPADLTPGSYEIGGGLLDAATGVQLTFETPEGAAQSLIRSEFTVPEDGAVRAAQLTVVNVQPAAGTVLSGTATIPFRFELSYDLGDLPGGYLEVRVVESLANDSGRGVGLAVVELEQASGAVTVDVIVDPSELAGPADLKLLLQLKPDAASAPIAGEMPEDIVWRYEP